MLDNNLFKDYTMQQALDKLDVIECFENPGEKLRVGEVLSRHHPLYLDLGVNPPAPYAETTLSFGGNVGYFRTCKTGFSCKTYVQTPPSVLEATFSLQQMQK